MNCFTFATKNVNAEEIAISERNEKNVLVLHFSMTDDYDDNA
jgi:hypothetical protein